MAAPDKIEVSDSYIAFVGEKNINIPDLIEQLIKLYSSFNTFHKVKMVKEGVLLRTNWEIASVTFRQESSCVQLNFYQGIRNQEQFNKRSEKEHMDSAEDMFAFTQVWEAAKMAVDAVSEEIRMEIQVKYT
jgi:hypothetical protein